MNPSAMELRDREGGLAAQSAMRANSSVANGQVVGRAITLKEDTKAVEEAAAAFEPRADGSSMAEEERWWIDKAPKPKPVTSKPTTPTLCADSNQGGCECATSKNIQTFTYWD